MAIVATSKHNAQPFRLFFAASILGHLLLAGVVFAMNSSLYRGPTAASTHSTDTIAVIFEPETQTAIKPQTNRQQNEPRHLISHYVSQSGLLFDTFIFDHGLGPALAIESAMIIRWQKN